MGLSGNLLRYACSLREGVWAFYWAISWKAQDGKVYLPSERISREEALKTATIWGAYYVLKENLLGSLEAGKFADFLVLDKDYLWRWRLVRLNRVLVAQAEGLAHPNRVVLDIDSSESPVYGEQEQSAYNAYFGLVCYHPLFLFNSQDDGLGAKLRPGNVHSAEGWEEVLLPEIQRQQQGGKEVAFRADAAFAKPEIYEALEARGAK